MVKTSIRLPPEICKKLESEARRLGVTGGVPVTVSDLIRACDLGAGVLEPGHGAGDGDV